MKSKLFLIIGLLIFILNGYAESNSPVYNTPADYTSFVLYNDSVIVLKETDAWLLNPYHQGRLYSINAEIPSFFWKLQNGQRYQVQSINGILYYCVANKNDFTGGLLQDYSLYIVDDKNKSESCLSIMDYSNGVSRGYFYLTPFGIIEVNEINEEYTIDYYDNNTTPVFISENNETGYKVFESYILIKNRDSQQIDYIIDISNSGFDICKPSKKLDKIIGEYSGVIQEGWFYYMDEAGLSRINILNDKTEVMFSGTYSDLFYIFDNSIYFSDEFGISCYSFEDSSLIRWETDIKDWDLFFLYENRVFLMNNNPLDTSVIQINTRNHRIG